MSRVSFLYQWRIFIGWEKRKRYCFSGYWNARHEWNLYREWIKKSKQKCYHFCGYLLFRIFGWCNAFSCIPLSFQTSGQVAFSPKYERCPDILQFHYCQNSCWNPARVIFVSCLADYCYRSTEPKSNCTYCSAGFWFDLYYGLLAESAPQKQFFSDTPELYH